MKKLVYLLMGVMIAATAGTKVMAQHRHGNDVRMQQQSFYYYPQSNVYFSLASGQYIYPYKNSWVVAKRLPRYISVGREPRGMVNHAGFDVWNSNRYHVYQFRNVRRDQPVVVYAPNDRHNNYRRPY